MAWPLTETHEDYPWKLLLLGVLFLCS